MVFLRGFLVCFSLGGAGVPCPPFPAVVAPLYPVRLTCMWCSVVVSFCVSGIRVAEGGGWILGSLARFPK